MKIAYNPLSAAALTTAPDNNDITFDLPGVAIYARGIKFKGTDTTYSVFKKHTSDSEGGYNGLVPVPSYTTTTTRFLREDGTWVTPDKTTSIHWDNIDGKPNVFNPSQHIHTTDDIKSLTNYAKATAIATITTSDSLNTALGKLEYKSDLGVTAYDWYKSVTDEDTDEHINKWNEIVDFLNGVTDTTLNGILTNFVNDLEVTGTGNAVTDVSKSNNKITVTKGNSFLPLSGGTISSSTYGALVVNRNTTSGHSGIKFSNNTEVLGILGVGGAGNSTYAYQPMFQDKDAKNYILIHSGNIGSQSVEHSNTSNKFLSKRTDLLGSYDCNNPTYSLVWHYGGVTVNNKPSEFNYGGILTFFQPLTSLQAQFVWDVNHNTSTPTKALFFRASNNLGWANDWKTIAFTDSNVASATKLQTARKIWGQSFDGTANVSGGLTGVSGITFISNGTTYGSYGNPQMGATAADWTVYSKDTVALLSVIPNGNVGIGIVNPQYKLDVNGNVRASGFIKSGSSSAYVLTGDGGHKLISDFVLTSSGVPWKGFTERTSGFTWGALKQSNGTHTPIFWLDSVNGGGVAFSDADGQTSMLIDGYFYQKEGTYRVTDITETVTALGTSGNYLTWTKNGTTNNITVPYATSATTATTASKLSTVLKTAWGQTYWTSGGIPTNISGDMTGVGNITISATGNKDYFINFLYNSTPAYSWRLGYLGSGSGNANYFVIDSSKSSGGTWHRVLQLGNETLEAVFSGSVTAPSFIGALKGNADTATTASKVANTLTFTAGTFAATSYNGSTAVTVKIPTKVSHLTNDSGFVTGGPYLPLSGGTLSSNSTLILRAGSSTSWYLGRSNAMMKINSYTGYNAIASMKTTNGDWSIGVYSSDYMYFTYVTDTNFNAGSNTTSCLFVFRPNGTIGGKADDADKVDSYHIAVQSSAGTDASTIYFVT